MTDPLFNRVALIGLGLLGSSMCHAMRRGDVAGHIAGTARSAETRKIARDIGLVDSIHVDPTEAVKDADLVVFCTPVGTYGELASQIKDNLKPGAILSDVGSVKTAVVKDVSPHVPDGVHFVPAHPVAGTEESGPLAGFEDLFDNRWCILTPVKGADPEAVEKLATFWKRLGSNIDMMDYEHHDRILAITSHLPHLIAYNLVGTVHDLETVEEKEVIKYSAGGFRDSTRLAASDPTMWRDIFLTNKDAVLEMLGRFSEDLAALQRDIRHGNGDALWDRFNSVRDVRKSIVEAGQESAVPDFGRHGVHKESAN